MSNISHDCRTNLSQAIKEIPSVTECDIKKSTITPKTDMKTSRIPNIASFGEEFDG